MRWSYDGAAGCPSGGWVLGRVARYLARPVPTGQDASLRVSVAIAGGANGEWSARLILVSPAGVRERTLHDADCVLVADAVAFIVARQIDPAVQADAAPLTADERARGQSGETPTAEAEPGAHAGSDSGSGSGSESGSESELIRLSPEPDVEPAPGPPLRVTWAFGAAGAVAWQPLPSLSPGMLLNASARIGASLRVELAAGYFTPSSRALASDPEVAAAFDLLHAALSACALTPGNDSQLGACLGVHAGLVRGRGDQLSDGQDGELPSVALALGPLLIQRLNGRVALRFSLAPSYGLVRPRFELDDGTAIHIAKSFGFVAALGAELRFD